VGPNVRLVKSFWWQPCSVCAAPTREARLQILGQRLGPRASCPGFRGRAPDRLRAPQATQLARAVFPLRWRVRGVGFDPPGRNAALAWWRKRRRQAVPAPGGAYWLACDLGRSLLQRAVRGQLKAGARCPLLCGLRPRRLLVPRMQAEAGLDAPSAGQFQLLFARSFRSVRRAGLSCMWSHDLDMVPTQRAISVLCLNRRPVLQWVAKNHALSPSRCCSELYGRQHRCLPGIITSAAAALHVEVGSPGYCSGAAVHAARALIGGSAHRRTRRLLGQLWPWLASARPFFSDALATRALLGISLGILRWASKKKTPPPPHLGC